MERICFNFWSVTEGDSESEQRSEKPSDARTRNLGRGSIVGGSDERNGQNIFAKLATDLLFEFPVLRCDGVGRTVDAGDSSSRRWRISGSAVIYGGVRFLTRNSSHGDVL